MHAMLLDEDLRLKVKNPKTAFSSRDHQVVEGRVNDVVINVLPYIHPDLVPNVQSGNILLNNKNFEGVEIDGTDDLKAPIIVLRPNLFGRLDLRPSSNLIGIVL